MIGVGLWSRWAIGLYEWSFRTLRRLDAPAAQAGPVLSVEVRRARRPLSLADGTVLSRRDLIGILHLNNRRVVALHEDDRDSLAVALSFRRLFLASLQALAALSRDGGRFGGVQAFSATTVYDYGLQQLGFAPAGGDRLAWPELVGLYEQALAASLRPPGRARGRPARALTARRLWISRERLLVLYGDAGSTAASRTSASVLGSRPVRS